jgi:hypothetical protein
MQASTPITDDDALSRLVQWHESADQSTADSRTECERDRDYVDGKQWTAEEEAKLKKRGQPVVTINRIKPKVDFLKGQEQQRRRMPKAYPRTPAEEEGAQAATDAIRFVTDASKWDRVRSERFDNHIVEGACGVDVQVFPKKDDPEDYCIEVKGIQWDRMWWDPHSRERDFSDAKYKGQYVWMDLEEAIEKWPEKKDILEGTLSQAGSLASETYDDVPRVRWADPKRRRVRIAECWSRESGRVFFSQFTKGGILSRMESPFLDEDGEQDDGFVFGSCFIDRDGNRYGVVRGWISIQDEINKRRSKAMHLMNVRQTFGNQSVDKNKLRGELAKPDGHAEMQGGAKFGEDFGVIPTGDMAAAQFQLLQEAKSEIDAVGVNAALSGTESRVMSGRALLAKSEQGLSELGPVYDAFSQFEYDVYRKVWARIRQFWTAEKWVRVTDDDRNVRFVGLNQPLTLGEQLLEEFKKQPGVTPEQIAQAEQQAAMDPRMQVVVDTKNKVAELDVDIVLDDVPASASLQTEQFEQLSAMAQAGVPIPPDAIVEASSLRNKDKILKKMRGEEEGELPPQVQQAMEAAQQQIAELQEQLAQAQATAQKAEAMGPAADLAKRELELEYERKLFEAQKRIAILEVRAAQTNADHAAERMEQASADLSAAAQEAQQQTEVDEVPLN